MGILGGAASSLFVLIWIGAWIFGIWLVWRFVRAVERIADAHEIIARNGRGGAGSEARPRGL